MPQKHLKTKTLPIFSVVALKQKHQLDAKKLKNTRIVSCRFPIPKLGLPPRPKWNQEIQTSRLSRGVNFSGQKATKVSRILLNLNLDGIPSSYAKCIHIWLQYAWCTSCDVLNISDYLFFCWRHLLSRFQLAIQATSLPKGPSAPPVGPTYPSRDLSKQPWVATYPAKE